MIRLLILLQLHLIPTEYLEFWNLYKYIIPCDSIVWWEAGVCNLSTQKHKPYFCSDTTVKVSLSEFSLENTYSSNYYTVFPGRYYLVYKTISGNLKYLSTVEQLITFIGIIDNLPEALLLAHMYGFSAKPNRKFGSFSFHNGVFTFNLYKILRPSDNLVFNEKLIKAKIKVDVNGDVYEFIGKHYLKWRKLSVKNM